MRRVLFISMLMNYILAANAQQESTYRKQLVFGIGGGLSMPFGKPKTADLMDARVGYRDRYWGLNPSLHLFVFKKWGFMTDFQIDVSAVNRDQRAKLDKAVDALYSRDYEILQDRYSYRHWDYESPATFRFTAGPVYRFEEERFLVYGSLGLGVTVFETTGVRADLLRRSSNNFYKVRLESSGNQSPFTITSGILIGYRFSRLFALALNTKASYFRTDLSNQLRRTDIYTGTDAVDGTFRYHRQHLNFSANLNLQVAANFKKRR